MKLRLFLVLTILLTSLSARAQSFTFKPYDAVEDEDLNEVQLSRFFNMARCLCDSQATEDDYSFYLGITSPGPYYDQEVYFLIGNYCDEAVSRPDCYELDAINYSEFNRQQNLSIPVNYIVDPMEGMCKEARATSTLHLFMTPERDNTVASYPIDFDTKPPGTPTITSVRGGEEAVIVYWDRPESGDEDIEFYNVLCEINGRAPEVSSASKADWTTTMEICGKDLVPDDVEEPVDAGVADGGVADGGAENDGGVEEDGGLADAGFEDAHIYEDAAVPDGAQLDGGEDVDGSGVEESCLGSLQEGSYPRSCFVCGSTGPTVRDIRIDGLPNGVEVRVAVVAVDGTRNVSYISNVETATALPTSDFAEQYRESGGSGKGGYCFIATAAYGSYEHKHVKLLRRFRDNVLYKTSAGTAFVNWYYRNGRSMARPFENSSVARGLLRLALLPCVGAAYIWVHIGGFAFFLIFGLIAGSPFFVKKAKKMMKKKKEKKERSLLKR